MQTLFPGYLGSQDTYFVGTIKGIGKIYQQTYIDTYAKIAICKLYDRKNALVAADLLNDRGSEYKGTREHYEYEL